MVSSEYCTKSNGVAMLLGNFDVSERKKIMGEGDYFIHGKEPTANTFASAIEVEKFGWYIGRTKTSISFADTVESVAEEANISPPEMIFGNNQMIMFHRPSGVCISFSAVEALKATHFSVQDRPAEQLKVKLVKNSDAAVANVKELDIPFDWTFTTTYKGSIGHFNSELKCTEKEIDWKDTDDCIDFVKLKEREPILWFDEVTLFEDELHDHGVSCMTVKTRVMPSGFYCLAQYWMRLDHVVIRLYETRLHHVFGSNFIIREYSMKESKFEELFAAGHPKSMAHYPDIASVQDLLTLQQLQRHKVQLN